MSDLTPTRRQRRRAERVLKGGRLVHPRALHGKYSSYINFGCRCVSCTNAWTDHSAQLRERRRAARVKNSEGVLVAPSNCKHGTHATKTNWGCQCRPCLDAHATYTRNSRQRGAA